MNQTKLYILLLLLLTLPSMMFAQRTLTGTVTDAETGETLIAASVRVAELDGGTLTDAFGKYTIQVNEGGKTLIVSYVGYQTQEIEIGDKTVIDVALSSGETLDEVVVIGYGTVKKEDATGSIQEIDESAFNKGAINSAQDLLAGKVAGVQITPSSDPGGGAAIRIRGGSSLSAINDPLIVIDGVPVASDEISGSRNPLNIINPNDIETFTVLKDASATAIYGSRASNGVIIITTKKGKLGKKISVDYTGNYTISDRLNQVDVFTADEFRNFIFDQFEEGHPSRELLGDANTDWQDEIYQTATGTDHNLTISGGVADIPYRVSLGYTDRDGILKTDNFNRQTASININPGFLDNTLQINLSAKGMLINNRFPERGAIGNAVFFDPTQDIYMEDTTYGGYYTWTRFNGAVLNVLAPSNPIALLEQTNDVSTVNRYIINGSVDYRFPFLPELRANLNLGYDRSYGEGTRDIPANAAFLYSQGGLDLEYSQTKINELLEFYLNYVNEVGGGTLDVMAGYSWQHFFRDNYVKATNVDETQIVLPEDTDPKEYYLLSLFGRANYSIDQFLFTFTLRQDGTSRFGPKSRWGLFPAAAVAYKILDQDEGTFNNLKLRLGYGVTGQQDIGTDYYPYLARYLASENDARYPFGDTYYTTLRPGGYDENIKWEETTTYNLGLDYGLYNNRITGALELYYRTTKDLINFIPVPAGTNLTNAIFTNIGNLTNQGIEFSVNALAIDKQDMSWDIGMNVTANRNEITKLTASEDPNYQGVQVGGISGGIGNTIQIHSVGFPANSFFVFKQVYDDNGNPIEGEYEDLNGDGTVTPEDRYRYENPAPDYYFGLTTNFNWKNLSLSMGARANVGNAMYNNIESNAAFTGNIYHPTRFVRNSHRSVTDINFEEPQYFSDFFIQDASFFRIDHITVSYNLTDLVPKISNLRVNATIQNPLLITNYTGLDPEVFGGIDNNVYPRSRTILFGLSAGF